MAWPPSTHQDVSDEITAIRAAWTAYTPSFTANTTNPTLGNFTRVGRYRQIGKTISFVIVITCNSTSGQGSGFYKFGLPVAARNMDEVVVIGSQTGPIFSYIGRCTGDASTVALISSADVTMNEATSGMTTGTVLRISGTYEAA